MEGERKGSGPTLGRSNTFSSPTTTPTSPSSSSSSSHNQGPAGRTRRKLPQIPPGALLGSERVERAESVGREINLLRNHPGYFYSGDGRKHEDTDSGYPSYDTYGEEPSVDSPSTGGLLPKRNSSNFLWVDFNEKLNDKSVTRRPKNHDRLVQARKNHNRHSAPPGSLEDAKILPSKKFNCDTNGSSVGKTPVPSVIKRSTSDKFSVDKGGLFTLMIYIRAILCKFHRSSPRPTEIFPSWGSVLAPGWSPSQIR